MMRLSAKGIGAAALAGAIVLGVTGVSFGTELFDRFMLRQAPVAA